METSVGEVAFTFLGSALGWQLAAHRREVWRWVRTRVLRRPVGWPTPRRRELVAARGPWVERFPCVPPTFMTDPQWREWMEGQRLGPEADDVVVLGRPVQAGRQQIRGDPDMQRAARPNGGPAGML